jgi:hypothetical protein
VLTTSELPSGGGTWRVESQGRFSTATPDNGQRVWVTSDHKQALEVDVIGTGTPSAAKQAYSAWETHAAANTLAHSKTSRCSKGAPSNCAVKTGATTSGKNEAVLTFQHSSALVAVVLVGKGSVDTNFLQQVGYAELQHLDSH